jgi:lipopolysaccharide transport system ATP-binding protein
MPGNLLAEGTLIIGVAISSFDPSVVHFYEKEAIAVQIVDELDKNGSRSIYAGPMQGFVRPKLEWKTLEL